MQLDQHLKDWRKRHGLTQAKAAAELGMVLPTYRGLEQGRQTPYDKVIAMAIAGWEAEKEAGNGSAS